MIQGHGNLGAKVMLVADGGSPESVTSNYALTGYEEIQLSQLSGHNFRVKDSWRTVFLKRRVNATDYDSYRQTVTAEDRAILIDEIQMVNPNLIIPLGEASFRFLSGLIQVESEGPSYLRKYRGSILPTDPLATPGIQRKLMGTYGPNPYLNQQYALRWLTQIDFNKVGKYSADNAQIPDLTANCWTAKTSGALRNYLERVYSDNGLLVFDIETFMGIPTCISFCFDGIESVTIPFMDREIEMDQRVLMVNLVARILASKIRKVNQNITYDWRILSRFGFLVNNVVGDTALAASVLTPELERNLGMLISIYTELPYHKDEGKEYDINGMKSKQKFYIYCAKDSLGTWQVNAKQQEEIDEIGSRYVYDSLCSLIPLYKRMEDTGLCIDDDRRQFLLARYYSKYNIEVLKLKEMVGRSINPHSPQVVAKLIYEELGFDRTRYARDTGEESLDWLTVFGEPKRSPIFGKTILQTIKNCRKLHKVIENLEIKQYPDGKWRATYNLGGAETGRSTSGRNKTEQLIVWGEKKIELEVLGHSFQNLGKHGFRIDGEEFGKDLRSMIVPRRGYVFAENDLSQAEARVDTILAGNFEILQVFDGPTGIHRLTGSWVFECEPSAIKKNTEQYHIAKTVRHAGERNMKADRLVNMIQRDLKFCEKILTTFHSMQPEMREVYHRDVINCVKSTGILRSPNGRVRQFLERRDSPHTHNEAISQLPQAIVADQTRFSLTQTFKEAPWAELLNEAHDGTLAQVPIGRGEEYCAIYKKNVETPIDFNNCSLARDFQLTIPCESSLSADNWQSLKEIHIG